MCHTQSSWKWILKTSCKNRSNKTHSCMPKLGLTPICFFLFFFFKQGLYSFTLSISWCTIHPTCPENWISTNLFILIYPVLSGLSGYEFCLWFRASCEILKLLKSFLTQFRPCKMDIKIACFSLSPFWRSSENLIVFPDACFHWLRDTSMNIGLLWNNIRVLYICVLWLYSSIINEKYYIINIDKLFPHSSNYLYIQDQGSGWLVPSEPSLPALPSGMLMVALTIVVHRWLSSTVSPCGFLSMHMHPWDDLFRI